MTTATTKLTGEVVRAGDSGYEAARVGWNRLYSRYPEAIVFCRDAQDVVNAVKLAREEGIALRARKPTVARQFLSPCKIYKSRIPPTSRMRVDPKLIIRTRQGSNLRPSV